MTIPHCPRQRSPPLHWPAWCCSRSRTSVKAAGATERAGAFLHSVSWFFLRVCVYVLLSFLRETVIAIAQFQKGEQDVTGQRYNICHDKRHIVDKDTVNQPECNTYSKQEWLPDGDVTGVSRSQGLYQLGNGGDTGERTRNQAERCRVHVRFLPSKPVLAQSIWVNMPHRLETSRLSSSDLKKIRRSERMMCPGFCSMRKPIFCRLLSIWSNIDSITADVASCR